MSLLFSIFIILMLLGMPIAFSMFVSSAVYLVANNISLITMVQRVATGIYSFPLLAAPCFIVAGAMMNSSGITDRLFNWCNKLVGHIPGGLGHTNILASMIFAGMSGTAVADAGGLGAVELKAMRDRGFDDDFSLAITGASSTIGPIIPPSLPLVMVGVVGSISIGRLYIAGIFPGIIMGILLAIMVYVIAKKRRYPVEPKATLGEIVTSSKKAFFPLQAVVITIGGILTGIITPTEAGVITLTYSVILGFTYKEINLKSIYGTFVDSTGTTLSVLFIIASATIFGWIIAIGQVPQTLTIYFMRYIENKWIALIIINLILLFVGCFMDTIAAITLLTPILMPIAISYGIDPVQFGVVMVLNLMIGLLTPPVGVVLYILSSVSGVSFDRIFKAVMPFLLMLLIALLLVTFIPALTLWLPNLVYN